MWALLNNKVGLSGILGSWDHGGPLIYGLLGPLGWVFLYFSHRVHPSVVKGFEVTPRGSSLGSVHSGWQGIGDIVIGPGPHGTGGHLMVVGGDAPVDLD